MGARGCARTLAWPPPKLMRARFALRTGRTKFTVNRSPGSNWAAVRHEHSDTRQTRPGTDLSGCSRPALAGRRGASREAGRVLDAPPKELRRGLLRLAGPAAANGGAGRRTLSRKRTPLAGASRDRRIE